MTDPETVPNSSAASGNRRPAAGVRRRVRAALRWLCPLLLGTGLLLAGGGPLAAVETASRARLFIAHRGVNLRSTIAGENSLEAIAYTRRAGFATIETDVRLTVDGQLVIMHDETLNRTCIAADGAKLTAPVPVASLTLAQLRTNYRLKADKPEYRTRVPTLREYLEECRRQQLLPFIEPKLNDPSGAHYRDIITVADDVLGRSGYIVTSNNRANRVIRGLGIPDVRLMGILYQTTFEDIARLGHIVMAISATRFKPVEFSAHVARAVAAGIPTESHGDTFDQFNLIAANPIDFVSTDELVPDLAPGVRPVVAYTDFAAFRTTGRQVGSVLRLASGDTLKLKRELPSVDFGGIYLELEIKGSAVVRLDRQQFTVQQPSSAVVRHQLIVYGAAPVFELTAIGECTVKSVSLKLAAF